MSTTENVVGIITSALQLGDEYAGLAAESPLLGAIPEFDSMAVVTILTALEETYDFYIEDDEIDAETFETVGTLVEFVKRKLKDG